MDYFTKEKNGYITIGTKLFGRTVEEGTNDYRQVKALVLGINYNMSVFGLARQLWDSHGIRMSSDYKIHEEEVGVLHRKYRQMFPKVVAYQQDRVRELTKYGSALGWFGHLLRLPLPHQPALSEGKLAYKMYRRHVSHLENEAINFRIQNAASYVTGTAMLDIERTLLTEYGHSYSDYHRALAENRSIELQMPLLTIEVHDSLVYDCPAKELKKAINIVTDGMVNLRTLKKLKPEFDAPMKIGCQFGHHWGEVKS